MKLVPTEALRLARMVQMQWVALSRPSGPSVSCPVASDYVAESRGRPDEERRRKLAACEVLAVPLLREHNATMQFGASHEHARYAIAVRSE